MTIPLNLHVVGPLLRQGKNVIAAEVHQASPSSPDLSFDLELVGVGNLLPNVALTSPLDGAWFPTPANIALAATAVDPYGQVTKVEFFRDGVSLGSQFNPPYQLVWNNPTPGAHILTAVATDDHNATRTSTPVHVTVLTPVMLTLQPAGPQLELTWPDTVAGYQLEMTTNLVPPVIWQPNTNTITQSGGLFHVPVDLSTAESFFRLRWP